MSKDEIIHELVELVLMQEQELNEFKERIRRIEQYIDTYEDYIKWRDV